MQVKSLRIPDDMVRVIKQVEHREHIEEATALRKLLRIGIESYVLLLYQQGALTLRETAQRLGLDLIATVNLMLERGIKGNLDATDVLESIERFVPN